MDDILRTEILAFIKDIYVPARIEDEDYKYLKDFNPEGDDIELKYYDIVSSCSKYNYILGNFIIKYIAKIKNIYGPIESDYKIRLKDYEPHFIELLKKILTNNYRNIRFDLTKDIILNGWFNNEIIIYFEDNGIFHLLEKIHPKRFQYYNVGNRENYIYERKMGLHWKWLGAVIKAFGLLRN